MIIVLVGLPGSGKTTLGRILARKLGLGFWDMDLFLEKEHRLPIAQLFRDRGESGFRDLENRALGALAGIQNHVIALGGGSVLLEEKWRHLAQGTLSIWVETPVPEIAQRLGSDREGLRSRPLFADIALEGDKKARIALLQTRLEGLLQKRAPFYSQAQHRFFSGFASLESLAAHIKTTLFEAEKRRPEVKREFPALTPSL